MSENQAAASWDRRDFIGAASLLALAIGVPVATIHFSDLDPAEAPGAQRIALLRDVAQLVIPRTTTPGAGDVGAGEFTLLALAHGLEKSRDQWPEEGRGAGGTAIHEMGGARMGWDPKTSVLSRFSRAHDVANLFVTDGAQMSSSACQNPSLTYMALTVRACDHAVSQLKTGAI